MPIPPHIVRDRGGTLTVRLPARPSSAVGVPAPQVTLRGPGNTVYVNAAAATIGAVNTTLGVLAAAGALSVTVADGTGIVPRGTYLLGGATDPPEWVRVRLVAAAVITLWRATRYAHAVGTAFVATDLSYAVTAAQATTLFFDGRTEWDWSSNGTTRNEREVRGVECVPYPYRRTATGLDMDRIDPRWRDKTDAELDEEDLLDEAFEQVLDGVDGRVRARLGVGPEIYQLATVFQAFVIASRLYGPAFRDEHEGYREEAMRAIRQIANRPFDLDRDGRIVRPLEGGRAQRRIYVG